MPNIKVVDENEKDSYIEVIAETELENGEKKDRRFKFKERQMKDESYKEVLKSWAYEIHSDYDSYQDIIGEEIEL